MATVPVPPVLPTISIPPTSSSHLTVPPPPPLKNPSSGPDPSPSAVLSSDLLPPPPPQPLPALVSASGASPAVSASSPQPCSASDPDPLSCHNLVHCTASSTAPPPPPPPPPTHLPPSAPLPAPPHRQQCPSPSSNPKGSAPLPRQLSYAQAARGSRGPSFVRAHASAVESFAKIPHTGVNIICGSKEGLPSFSFVSADLSRVEELYANALVMKFRDGRPSLEASHREILSWGMEKQFSIGPLSSRAFLLRFQDGKDLLKVLTRPLFARKVALVFIDLNLFTASLAYNKIQ